MKRMLILILNLIIMFGNPVMANTNVGEVFLKQGEFLLKQGKLEDARCKFQQAIGVNSKNLRANLDLALCLCFQSEYGKAIKYFEKVYDKDYYKDKFEVIYVMAQLYDKLAEEIKAYEFYEKASKLKPLNSNYYEIAQLDNFIFQNHDKILITLLK